MQNFFKNITFFKYLIYTIYISITKYDYHDY